MQDLPHYVLGQIDGAEVGVQHTQAGQDLLMQHSHRTEHLARLLARARSSNARPKSTRETMAQSDESSVCSTWLPSDARNTTRGGLWRGKGRTVTSGNRRPTKGLSIPLRYRMLRKSRRRMAYRTPPRGAGALDGRRAGSGVRCLPGSGPGGSRVECKRCWAALPHRPATARLIPLPLPQYRSILAKHHRSCWISRLSASVCLSWCLSRKKPPRHFQ
jgi:hypothetical protein